MARFSPKSRYARFAGTYVATDRRGRLVTAVTVARIPPPNHLGDHRRTQGQRLDHLSHYYLSDPIGYWRIAEHNGAILPDALAETTIVRIPGRI